MSYAYLASTPGLKFNYSLFSVPAGWAVAMAPLWWAIGAANLTAPGTYQNAHPGESWAKLDDAEIPRPLKGRIKRAVAANNNTHVNLPLFAAGLAAANASHVDSASLHLYSAGFLLSRVAYNLSYILIEDEAKSWLRSIFYWTGVGSCFALYIKAALKYKSLPW
ncbi:uncharacterized protein I303_104507 [Kwoniella dejecticola CBS 10117]|uniref:Uncharacterized protein n=1 Tax=Kwoniella dejecticola CBS 10117 TaxID=1296121 RepID=A0A1A6A568_9TREE|nr:uncharacterized protein I303_04515 [Kwoniella dejecticola CBS 10117]OBR85183.1 hypothetical protein I303_04515 [Kwoniella dejecticola CBS 10117]